MTLEDLLFQCIKSTEYGVYKVIAPQNTPTPYVVSYVVADTKTNCAGGEDTSYDDVRFTMNCYANSLSEVKSMSEEIMGKIRVCTTFSAIIYTSFEDSNDGIVFRSVIDFKLNN